MVLRIANTHIQREKIQSNKKVILGLRSEVEFALGAQPFKYTRVRACWWGSLLRGIENLPLVKTNRGMKVCVWCLLA